MRNQDAAIKNIEMQVGQLANSVAARQQGTLPSTIEKNPREEAKSIKVVRGEEFEQFMTENDAQVCDPNSDLTQTRKQKMNSSGNKNLSSVLPDKHHIMYIDELPYPAQLLKDEKNNNYSKFVDVFKNLRFNIPFLDAILSIPNYVKFLRNFLSEKKNEDVGVVRLTEKCSAILQSKLPPKLSDPGSFTLPCELKQNQVINALCDLGASINLIPLSLCRKYNLGKIKKSSMRLQMADQTMKEPVGILEDVLVKIGTFIFPADFVVLDMDEDEDMPLIIGRPLLRTARALIDVHQGKLTIRLNDQSLEFNMNVSAQFSSEHDSDPACHTSNFKKDLVGCERTAKGKANNSWEAG